MANPSVLPGQLPKKTINDLLVTMDTVTTLEAASLAQTLLTERIARELNQVKKRLAAIEAQLNK